MVNEGIAVDVATAMLIGEAPDKLDGQGEPADARDASDKRIDDAGEGKG